MKARLRSLLALAAICVLPGACSETAGPAGREIQTPHAPSQSLLGGVLYNVLQRTLPLSQNVAATATIGPAGGVIQIPQAGFAITFPAGAVSAPVTVTATALAGSNVAYDFQPHGLVFQNAPVISQSLGLTQVVTGVVSPSSLAGGYFADDSQLGTGYATISELCPTQVNLLALRMTFTVQHFSGYAATDGRKGGYLTASGDRTSPAGAQLSPAAGR